MRNFDRRDRERLILSTALALAFMAVVFAIFGVLDLFHIEMPEYSGPIYVSLGDTEEERIQEPSLEESPLEEPSPEAETEVREEIPPRPETRQAQAEPAPRRAGERAASGDETAEPGPAAPRTDTAPPDEPPERTEEAPAGPGAFERTGPEGRLERVEERPLEVQPEQVTPRTGGEEGTAPGTQEAGEVEAPDDRLFDDLSSLDQALAQADTGETGESEGATDGQADGEETGEAERSIGTPENPVTLDQLSALRQPIHLGDPQIDPELARNLPPKWNLQISFTLLPSGYITDLQISPDSGNTEFDSTVREAIRKWRFEAVGENAGSVRVRVLYTITVR